MPPAAMPRDAIVVLDYGSQYSQLIVRRVRECSVYAEMLPWDAPAAELDRVMPKGIILSGGPNSVYEARAPYLTEHVLERGIPILGICYGMQLLAHQLGGRVTPATHREYGLAQIHVDASDDPLFREHPWRSAGVDEPRRPDRCAAGRLSRRLARSGNTPLCRHAASRARACTACSSIPRSCTPRTARDHAELCAWVSAAARPTGRRAPSSRDSIDSIRATGGRRACDLRALRRRGFAVVGHAGAPRHRRSADGDLRQQRPAAQGRSRGDGRIASASELGDRLSVRGRHRDASSSALEGVTDPEQKRVIIGGAFIDVFEQEAAQPGSGRLSGAGHALSGRHRERSRRTRNSAARIKTHHNVGGLPEDMRFKLVEPLRYLFKDEVREVGLALGLPEEMVCRQPFPGPGLAVRIIGEVTRERLATLRAADAIVRDEIAAAGLDREVWQYFAVLTPAAQRGRDGRRPHLRQRGRGARRHQRGRHDGRLGAPALRRAGAHLQPHRQRGARRQPGGV